MAAIIVVGGCGNDDLATSSTLAPSAHQSQTETSTVDGTWEQSVAELVTSGIATQSDIPAERPFVQAMGSTGAGYVVAGSVNGAFAVWRSTDLKSFTPIYSEVCCARFLYPSSIAEFKGTLLIGGAGEFGTDTTRQAFILRSDDGGASWTLIDDPLFTSMANRVDRIIATDEAVLVETVDDRAIGARPLSVASWSDDLTTWQPIQLPGRQADDWPWFVQNGKTVFAIAQRESGQVGRVFWRSDDGGLRFVAAPTLADSGIGRFIAVGDNLVGIPDNRRDEQTDADLRGLFVLEGSEWRELQPDTGTWGDGWTTTYPSVASEPSGRTYTLVSRTMRASAHYCYDDVETCNQPQTVLLATEDGTTWHDVGGFPASPDVVGNQSLVSTDAAGNVVVLAINDGEAGIRVTRWVGSAPPPLIDNPDYAEPSPPVRMYDYTHPFNVGDDVRYPLGVGGCATTIYINGGYWAPEAPLPDPPPADWPYRPVQTSDGPQGYIYGRIHRLTEDTIGFSIENLGPVATFHPAAPPPFPC